MCRFYVPFLKILFLTLGETLFPTGVCQLTFGYCCSAALPCQASRAVVSCWALGVLLSMARWRICTKNDCKAIKPGTFILATRNQKHFYKEKYKSSGTLWRADSHQGVEFCQGSDAEVLPSLAARLPHVSLGNFGSIKELWKYLVLLLSR